MPDRKERPLGYFSRILRGPELAYFASEGECLAIVKSVKHFRPYLYGRFFIVETDHQALTTLQRMAIVQKDPNSRFMRWSMALQEYHYEILYKKGVNNGNTDGLTRCPHEDDLPGHWNNEQEEIKSDGAREQLKNGALFDKISKELMAETHRHILMASTTSGAASPSGSMGLPNKDAPTDTSTPETPFSARKRGKKGKGKRKGRHPSHAADAKGNVIKLSKPMHGLDNPDEISKDGKVEEYTGDDLPKGPP